MFYHIKYSGKSGRKKLDYIHLKQFILVKLKFRTLIVSIMLILTIMLIQTQTMILTITFTMIPSYMN